MKKLIGFLLTIVLVFSVCACGNTNTVSDKIQVYTSFYAMYDFAKQIGGDKADVHILCQPSQEPHEYEPTAQDIANIIDADVFIYNGMGMEHWADSVKETLSGSDIIVVETSNAVDGSGRNTDPHIWLNPQNALEQLRAITDAFIKADNGNVDYYTSRFKESEEKINQLTHNYKTAVETFSSKDIVVSHEAYSNMCNAFGLNQLAVNGTDNSEDPTPTRMAEIEKYIKDNNIKYVFTEPLGTSSIVETIAKDTNCEILILDPFEGNTENKDYFTVMNENLEALKKALK